tara:strand:- start:498 stop:962 length:465 start_codon:yes stop_codon:yes gene_type:complete
MKKLITLLFFFATTIIYSQTEIGNFKIKDGRLIWQKVYDENLNLESQDLKLRAVGLPKMTTTFFIQDISGAKLKVQKKDGRTRLTVSEMISTPSAKINTGYVEETGKDMYAEDFYVNRKGIFKKLFIKKDAEIIHNIILGEITRLLGDDDDDDW